MSGQVFGSEDVFTEIPNQSSSVEGVLNLEPDPFMKRLPHRHNRGIPKPTYEPELSTKVKYPMSNYVSNHRLSESNKSFVNQLSTVAIPNSVQEALTDPRWKAAMNEDGWNLGEVEELLEQRRQREPEPRVELLLREEDGFFFGFLNRHRHLLIQQFYRHAIWDAEPIPKFLHIQFVCRLFTSLASPGR